MSDPYLWILSAVIFIPMYVVGLARIQVWEKGLEDQVLLTPGFFVFVFGGEGVQYRASLSAQLCPLSRVFRLVFFIE